MSAPAKYRPASAQSTAAAPPRLSDLLDRIRGPLLPAAVVAAVAFVAAYFVIERQPPAYEAESTLLLVSEPPNGGLFDEGLATAPRLAVSTYLNVMGERQVVRGALEARLGREPQEDELTHLLDRVRVRAEDAGRSALLHVTVRHENPTYARDMANQIARAGVAWDQARTRGQLQRLVDDLAQRRTYLEQELSAGADPSGSVAAALASVREQETRVRAMLAGGGQGHLEPLTLAVAPTNPAAPQPLRYSVPIALACGMLAYALMLVRSLNDPRVRSVASLVEAVDVPVLAALPAHRPHGAPIGTDSVARARSTLAVTSGSQTPVVLVSAPDDRRASQHVARAVASAFARSGRRTLLLDADLRASHLSGEIDPEALARASTMAFLRGEAWARPARLVLDRTTRLDVLAAAQRDGEEAPEGSAVDFVGAQLRNALERLDTQYQAVVVHAPPVLRGGDIGGLAGAASAVVLAVSMDGSRQANVANAVSHLRESGADVRGLILTNVRAHHVREVSTGVRFDPDLFS